MFRTSMLARALAIVALGFLLSVAAACGSSEEDVDDASSVAMGADHHMHLSTAVSAAHLDSVGVVVGERDRSDPPSVPRSATDAIAALDRADVGRGLILSNAYLYGMPEAPVDGEAELVRAENEYVLSEAARYPDRLRALCSVNPLEAYAAAEIEWCVADPRAGGLKLHLANSDVRLDSVDHVAALRGIFIEADEGGLPILIHLRTRGEYGADQVDTFIDEVLAATSRIPIQIAHMAGWGGYDDATHEALGAFAAGIREGRVDPARVSFGLGAVVFDPAAAGADSAMAESVRAANERLAGLIREIGPERVVYATDWPSWPPGVEAVDGVALNRELIRRELPLEASELDQIMGNVGPIFGWSR